MKKKGKRDKLVTVELKLPEGAHDFLTRFAALKKKTLEEFVEEVLMGEVDWILEGSGLQQVRGEYIADLYGLGWKPLGGKDRDA